MCGPITTQLRIPVLKPTEQKMKVRKARDQTYLSIILLTRVKKSRLPCDVFRHVLNFALVCIFQMTQIRLT